MFRSSVIPAFARRAGSERGAALVFVALTIALVCSMAALAVDVGLLVAERTHLQAVADASALAGAAVLPDEVDVKAEVQSYSALNHASAVVLTDEIVLGHWDADAGLFQVGGSPIDAVSVIVRSERERAAIHSDSGL